MLARYISGKLHKEAVVAQPDVERVEDFGFVEPLLRNVALT
jgi:hypothetical protein